MTYFIQASDVGLVNAVQRDTTAPDASLWLHHPAIKVFLAMDDEEPRMGLMLFVEQKATAHLIVPVKWQGGETFGLFRSLLSHACHVCNLDCVYAEGLTPVMQRFARRCGFRPINGELVFQLN